MKTILAFFVFAIHVAVLSAQNVGIGTTMPEAKLDVVGNIKITDGTEGADKVLTSDANGLASWQAPPASPKTAFVVATDQSVGNNDFVSLGTSSSTFSRSSLVVPVDCELTAITFSIRELVFISGIAATVWLQSGVNAPVATPLSAFIADGFLAISSTGTGSVFVNQGDLISVQIDLAIGGALSAGVTAAISYR